MSQAIELQNAKKYIEIGRQKNKKGTSLDAIASFQKATSIYEKLERWPDFLQVVLEVAGIYNELTQFEKSIKYLQMYDKLFHTFEQPYQRLKAAYYLSMGSSLLRNHELIEGEKYIHLALPIFQQKKDKEIENISECYSNLAFLYGQQGDYALQKKQYEKAIKLLSTIPNAKRSLSIAYENIGASCRELGLFEEMLAYLHKSLAIIKEIDSANPSKIANNYLKIGYFYNIKGDYSKALHFSQKALSLTLPLATHQPNLLAQCYNALGYLVGMNDDHVQQLKYFDEERKVLLSFLDPAHFSLCNNYQNTGYAYTKLGQFEKGILWTKKGLAILAKTYGAEHPMVAQLKVNLAFTYSKIERFKESLELLLEAKSILLKHFKSQDYQLFNLFKHLALYYYKVKDTKNQLIYIQKALLTLCKDFSADSYRINPSSQEKQNYPTDYHEIMYFKTLALWAYYQQKNDKLDLIAAQETALLLLHFIEKNRQKYETENAKLLLANTSQKFFAALLKINQAVINIAETAKEKEMAYQYIFRAIEQAKAVILLSNIKEIAAKSIANIPKPLLTKEKELTRRLTYLTKNIAKQKAKGANQNEQLIIKFQGQYFDTKQEYDALIQQFERDYPEYYQLKEQIKTATIKDIQANLSYDACLISYFLYENEIYIFAITPTTYQFQSFPHANDIREMITAFHEFVTTKQQQYYQEVAHELYELLVAPILQNDIGKDSKQLIIIPQGELLRLPFEALLSKSTKTDNANLPYLIAQYTIKYHYSATLWTYNKAKEVTTTDTFLGLAPITFDGSQEIDLVLESEEGENTVLRSNQAGNIALQSLPNTEAEVKSVYQLFQDKQLPAKAFLYGSASKENLIKEAANHKYLLIATHGFVENEEQNLSGIYLANCEQKANATSLNKDKETVEKTTNLSTRKGENNPLDNYQLYTSDVYQLDLQADLVVLSSCSSGVGKIYQGEGVMAISRGFLHAGANNIIFTQFDIPDSSSSELVKHLFSYILAGETYSTALQKAKLKLIQQDKYWVGDWAAYILVGR